MKKLFLFVAMVATSALFALDFARESELQNECDHNNVALSVTSTISLFAVSVLVIQDAINVITLLISAYNKNITPFCFIASLLPIVLLICRKSLNCIYSD